MIHLLHRALQKVNHFAKSIFLPDPHSFLKKVNGVIHIGANTGQERERYNEYVLSVIWVEPIPEVFEKLQENILNFPKQKAYRYLLTDCDDQTYKFNIASNDGRSSSILDFAQHKDIWPTVHYTDSIELQSATLPTMIQREGIPIQNYQALVMDTQGSELLVLKGAKDLLKNFRYIKVEAADFESYTGCCQVSDLTNYLEKFGFRERQRIKFAERSEGGSYFDVLYVRA